MVIMCWGSSVKGSGEVIRASASYTSGWDSFVLLKMDRVRVARGGSLSMLHQSTPFPTPTGSSNLSGRVYAGSSLVQLAPAGVNCIPLNLLPLAPPL